jgi:hypothetical protein
MARATAFAAAGIAAADDAQRGLLLCVLRDAREWHYVIMEACPACRAAGGACLAHWDQHEEPCQEYRALAAHLEGYEGTTGGVVCPLDSGQRRALRAAVTEAVSYRQETRRETRAPEGAALAAAYRELLRQVPAARD